MGNTLQLNSTRHLDIFKNVFENVACKTSIKTTLKVIWYSAINSIIHQRWNGKCYCLLPKYLYLIEKVPDVFQVLWVLELVLANMKKYFIILMNFHHWLHGKLPSGTISNKNLVKMTTFRFCKLLNIFACGMQRVDAARTAMLDIVHEITP